MVENKHQQQTSIEHLPGEVIVLILSILEDPKYYLFFSSHLNKAMGKILAMAEKEGHTKSYWSKLYQSHFLTNKPSPSLNVLNFKDLCIKGSKERKAKNRNLTKEQLQLFNWTRFGDLGSIEKMAWKPDTDFMRIFDAENYNLVRLANKYKRISILNYFYEQACIHIFQKTHRDSLGLTKLHWAAACNDSKLKSLANKDNINKRYSRGVTPLSIAAEHGNFEAVRILLDRGAKVNQPRSGGITPLHLAAYNGHLEIVKILIDKKANVNQACIGSGVTPLYLAAQNGHFEIVKILLESGANVDQARTDDGATPLHLAVQNGHLEIVKILLDKKANVNQACINDGATPLHWAVQNGYLEIVKILLESGANVNQACTTTGATPLHLAAQHGNLEAVRILLESGARIDLKCLIKQASPLATAELNKRSKVFALLTLWSVKIDLINKTILEKIIAILKKPVEIESILQKGSRFLHSTFWRNPESPLEKLISELQQQSRLKNEPNKKDLIKMIEQNSAIIPTEKREFISKYLLQETNLNQELELGCMI